MLVKHAIFQYKVGAKHRRMNCGKVGKVTAAAAREAAEKFAADLVHHKDPANERATVRKEASLSAFFRWAIGEGLCEENPVTGTNKQEEKWTARACS
jgi:site-specific recombinase XerD